MQSNRYCVMFYIGLFAGMLENIFCTCASEAAPYLGVDNIEVI